ncbi:hypothetical protein Tco_0956544 [Tanacetum coccineum]
MVLPNVRRLKGIEQTVSDDTATHYPRIDDLFEQQKRDASAPFCLPEGSEDFPSHTAMLQRKGLGACVEQMHLSVGNHVHGVHDIKRKANVVADALSRKEREPLRLALVMTIGLDLPKQILTVILYNGLVGTSADGTYVRPKHQRPSGFVSATQDTSMEVGTNITMILVMKLPKSITSSVLEGLQVDDKLHFVEEPAGPGFTWERGRSIQEEISTLLPRLTPSDLEELLAKHQEESARRSTEMEVWIKKLQENAKINTRNQSASLKNLETQIEQLTKEIRSDKTLNSSSEQIKTITADQETSGLNKLIGVSFILRSESFVIIDNTPSETTILGRPFLATIHVEIDVFAGKISLGINEDRVSFDTIRKDHKYTNPSERIFMVRPQSPAQGNNQIDYKESSNWDNTSPNLDNREPKKQKIDLDKNFP